MAIPGTVLYAIEVAVAEAILSAIGLVFAGVGAVVLAIGILWQRQRIIAKFEQALNGKKHRFQTKIVTRLNEKLDLIYEEVERIFTQFYNYVDRKTEAVEPMLSQYHTLAVEATALFSRLDQRIAVEKRP